MKTGANGKRYHPIHIQYTKPQFKKLIQGGSITIKPYSLHPPMVGGSLGASFTYLPEDLAHKVNKALKTKKPFRLKLSPDDIEYNTINGAGFWNDIVDFGKKAVSVVANDVLPVISQIADVLPIQHPYFQAFKAGLKVAENLTKKLDSVVNKKEQAELDVLEAEETYLDKKAQARQSGVSASQKSKLLEQAEAAKQRIKQKQAEAKRLAAEEKKLQKEKLAAEKQAKAAEQKALKEAQKIKQSR